MQLSPVDQWFLSHPEPLAGCLQSLRSIILQSPHGFAETWKYSMPVYCLNNKMTCYLWVDKKTKHPYLGIVEGSKIQQEQLIQDKRRRMKIWLFDPASDLPLRQIQQVLKQVASWYL